MEWGSAPRGRAVPRVEGQRQMVGAAAVATARDPSHGPLSTACKAAPGFSFSRSHPGDPKPAGPVKLDRMTIESTPATARTLAWLEHAVIGLNLCPFAKAPHAKGQVRCVESPADDPASLVGDLVAELERLSRTPPERLETTLLVHPRVFTDFDDFNDFLGVVEDVVADLGLEGEIQVASFHPDYRFEGTEPDDVTNATNRSPHPTLHLLREAGIDRAVAAFPEAETIYEANMATMERLGSAGWAELEAGWRDRPEPSTRTSE